MFEPSEQVQFANDIESIKRQLVEIAKMLEGNDSHAKSLPKFISRKDLANMFGVTLKTVHEWTNLGILRPIRIGNRCIRFNLEETIKSISERKKLA